MIAYCTSPSSTPARSSAPRIAIEPSSVAWWPASAPPSLPNGVRTAETITERDIERSLASEVEAGLEPLCEAHHEANRRLDVVQRDDFAGAVDVAGGERHEPGRDARAAGVGGIHVGVRVPRRDVDRVRDGLGFGGFDQQLEDLRIDRRPAVDDRSGPELGDTVDLRVALGDIGRAGHVDRKRHLRLEREHGRARAAVVADLLLYGRDRRDIARRAAGLGHAPR